MPQKVIFLITLSLFPACSFNKVFLEPTKAPPGVKSLTLAGADTTTVFFNGDNHQPVFVKNQKDTMDLGFTIESFIFKSQNGNALNGWLLRPKNTEPALTLLHIHGNGGFLYTQLGTISPLVKKGFQVFMFDYSGYGFSEGEATRNNALADALAAFDFAKSRPEIKNTKLVVYGQSFGGHLSAVVATQKQNDLDGLVIEGAFSSPKDIAAHRVPLIGRLLARQGYSAKKSIKDFHKPLLVIHSKKDKVIPFYMGKRIFDRANQPKEFYEVNECHICAPRFYADSISMKIKKMLAERK